MHTVKWFQALLYNIINLGTQLKGIKLKEEGGGWYASSATERKEHVESISLVEGGQPSFYAENIPFSSLTIFFSRPTPKLVFCCASPRLKTLFAFGAFRQDLYNRAKMPHLGQSHNMVIYVHADTKHDSQWGGCEFDLPNRPFLSPWSHFTRQTYLCTFWTAVCMISLTTQVFLFNKNNSIQHYSFICMIPSIAM